MLDQLSLRTLRNVSLPMFLYVLWSAWTLLLSMHVWRPFPLDLGQPLRFAPMFLAAAAAHSCPSQQNLLGFPPPPDAGSRNPRSGSASHTADSCICARSSIGARKAVGGGVRGPGAYSERVCEGCSRRRGRIAAAAKWTGRPAKEPPEPCDAKNASAFCGSGCLLLVVRGRQLASCVWFCRSNMLAARGSPTV